MTSTAQTDPAAARRIALVVAFVFFIQLLDSTIILTSLPRMAEDFGITPVAMSVGLTSYLLALAMALPAAGWLGERFGAKRVLVVSISVFMVASLACAFAPRIEAFVAARVFQGLATALMAPVGRQLVLAHAPKSKLIEAIATLTWPALFAPVVGPILGGWITVNFGWEWNFLINLPLGVMSLVLVGLVVPAQSQQSVRSFDAVGFVLTSLALLSLFGGAELFVAGVRPGLYLTAIAGGFALAILAARHFGKSPAPLFDPAVVRIATFRMASLTNGTASRVTINSMPFLLPLFFQVSFGLTPIEAGQLLMIYFIGNLAMKTITTRVMRRFGFRRILLANGFLTALSVGVFAFVGPQLVTLVLWVLLFLAGATRSLQFTALNTLAFADIDGPARSTSTTLLEMSQQLSILLGVAVPVLFIRLSEMARGATATEVTDFRVAFLALGLTGLVATAAFLRLGRDAGAEVTGRGKSETAKTR